MTAKSALVVAGFEQGNGTQWMIRRETNRGDVCYVVTRAGIEVGRYGNATEAYAEYHRHVAPHGVDMEASLGR